MANQLVINGKNTVERLHEEYQKLLESYERITVTEFARRVDISSQTLTHYYRDWAEKVRRLRDERRSKPRKRPPVTLSPDQVTEFEQAIQVITKLRDRITKLENELSAFSPEENIREKWEQLNKQFKVIKEENERLRGVIVKLQQEIMRYMPPDLSRRLMSMIEEHAAEALGTDTGGGCR